MTQKKDRRSARTRELEWDDRQEVEFLSASHALINASFSPANPCGHSSSAPMVPEVSQ
jgi:hypothetical protein